LEYESRAAIEGAVIRPHYGGYQIQTLASDSLPPGHKTRLFRKEAAVGFRINRKGDLEPDLGTTYPLADLPQASVLQFAEPPIRAMKEDIHDVHASDSSEACYREAVAALENRDFELSAAICQKGCESLVSEDEFGQCLYRIWAAAQLGMGCVVDARNVCDRGDRSGFGSAALEFERARALFELGEIKDAMIAATRSLALEWPEHAQETENEADAKRYALRGQLLARLGEHSQAASMFDRALGSDPGFGIAMLGKAQAFEQLNLLDLALEGFLAGQDHPEIGQTCLKEAARMYSKMSLPKKSVPLYREAWNRCQEDKEAWNGWRNSAEECGQLEETLSAFQALSNTAELEAAEWMDWGRALEESDQRFRALDAYQKSIDLDPEVAASHFRIGNLLRSVDRKEQAAEAYERALKLDEENADGWFVLGDLLADIGLLHGAKVSFLRGLSLAPDNAHAQKQFERICRAA
jgi:tetratricopeptide (TPR) repeat protein